MDNNPSYPELNLPQGDVYFQVVDALVAGKFGVSKGNLKRFITLTVTMLFLISFRKFHPLFHIIVKSMEKMMTDSGNDSGKVLSSQLEPFFLSPYTQTLFPT